MANEQSSSAPSVVSKDGKLSYQYNPNSPTPDTFTITFQYTNSKEPSANWEFTTPAIPYANDFNFVNYLDLDTALGFDTKEILVNPEELCVKKYIDDAITNVQYLLKNYVQEADSSLHETITAEIDQDVAACNEELKQLVADTKAVLISMIPTHTPMTSEQIQAMFTEDGE